MFGIGYCGGLGVAGWALMVGFWLAVIGLVVWALIRLFPSGARRLDIEAELDRRRATGQMDPATYQQLRDELISTGRR